MKNNEKVIAKPNNIFTDLSQNVSQKDQKVAEDNSGAYNKDKELKDMFKALGCTEKDCGLIVSDDYDPTCSGRKCRRNTDRAIIGEGSRRRRG